MTGMAGAPGVGVAWAGNHLDLSTRYGRLHCLWEHTLDVAYDDGRAAGFEAGRAYGYDEGWCAGFMAPDPPPAGSTCARALERATVLAALWPTAETLADAVAAFLRDVERARARAAEHHNRNYGVDHDASSVLGNPPVVDLLAGQTSTDDLLAGETSPGTRPARRSTTGPGTWSR